MDYADKKRKVEHLLRVRFPFSWAPPPVTPARGGQSHRAEYEVHERLMGQIQTERTLLWQKPDHEIEQLFSASKTEERARAEMRAAVEEKSRFFNKRDAVADTEYWIKAERWTVDEAVALLLGKDPDVVTWEKVAPFTHISKFAKDFQRLRSLALRADAMNRGRDPVEPSAVLVWADKRRIPVPADLRAAMSGAGLEMASAPSVQAEPLPAESIGKDSGKESPKDRRARRLARFRGLGGEMRRAGTGWQQSGAKGALATLAREEAASGRPMSDKKNVREDLISALEEQRRS